MYTFTLLIAEEVLLVNKLESEFKELVVSSKFKASNTYSYNSSKNKANLKFINEADGILVMCTLSKDANG